MIRIEKQFAPMTITIETKEDKDFLEQIIRLAMHQQDHPWYSPKKRDDQRDFVRKLTDLLMVIK